VSEKAVWANQSQAAITAYGAPAKRNANAARRAGDGGYKNEMLLVAFLPSEEKK